MKESGRAVLCLLKSEPSALRLPVEIKEKISLNEDPTASLTGSESERAGGWRARDKPPRAS